MLVEQGEGLAPVLGEQDAHPAGLEHAADGEQVAHVVVDQQRRPLREEGVGRLDASEHLALVRRQPGLAAVQVQRRLEQQPLRRGRVLDDDRLGVAAKARLVASRQRLAGVDDDRQVAEAARPP